MIVPPSTVEIVTSTSGWSNPAMIFDRHLTDPALRDRYREMLRDLVAECLGGRG